MVTQFESRLAKPMLPNREFSRTLSAAAASCGKPGGKKDPDGMNVESERYQNTKNTTFLIKKFIPGQHFSDYIIVCVW